MSFRFHTLKRSKFTILSGRLNLMNGTLKSRELSPVENRRDAAEEVGEI